MGWGFIPDHFHFTHPYGYKCAEDPVGSMGAVFGGIILIVEPIKQSGNTKTRRKQNP